MNSIALAYAGVHQIFQLALAAHELGELDGLLCSVIDRPGKIGAWLPRLVRMPSARPLGFQELPAPQVQEFPWPLLVHRASRRLLPWRRSDYAHTSEWFDRRAARWLRGRKSQVFVGGETCALYSLRSARERGMRCVLDCPGIPSAFLDAVARRAAEDFGLPEPRVSDSQAMRDRKRQEWQLADIILACSDLHESTLVDAGAPSDRIRMIPLWADVDFWQEKVVKESREGNRLRVLYAGAISLRKGVPYLLQAVQGLGDAVSLTLVGDISRDITPILARFGTFRHVPYVPRPRLRELYQSNDVLVMPTLGDSFGFVAVEAMSAGLPVIASQHAGATLPDASWRVPVADARAIAERLRYYLDDRIALARDSVMARQHARQFRPERYRIAVRALFTDLLNKPTPA